MKYIYSSFDKQKGESRKHVVQLNLFEISSSFHPTESTIIPTTICQIQHYTKRHTRTRSPNAWIFCFICPIPWIFIHPITTKETSSQAPSYARRLQSETMTYSLTHSLTGVKCRATSVAKNRHMMLKYLNHQSGLLFLDTKYRDSILWYHVNPYAIKPILPTFKCHSIIYEPSVVLYVQSIVFSVSQLCLSVSCVFVFGHVCMSWVFWWLCFHTVVAPSGSSSPRSLTFSPPANFSSGTQVSFSTIHIFAENWEYFWPIINVHYSTDKESLSAPKITVSLGTQNNQSKSLAPWTDQFYWVSK